MQQISLFDENQTILVTGGCGFIGHHFVEHVIKNTKWKIIIIDKLTYASMGFKRINESIFEDAINIKRLKIYTWDLSEKLSIGMIQELNNVNIIVHMAAETHVDNSISDPELFVKNNILSTLYILEYARTLKNLVCFFILVQMKYMVRHLETNFLKKMRDIIQQIHIRHQNLVLNNYVWHIIIHTKYQ